RNRHPMPPIGYYVHHHGAGHAHRFGKIRSHCEAELVPISEKPMWGGLRLPSDVPPHPIDPTAGGSLHWAPIDVARMSRRSQVIAEWIVAHQPRGFVIDVSVEIAILCRLFGVPTVVVRQHGDRTDAGHELAYRSARRLLAPFPAALEHHSTPPWIVTKTEYSGFVMSDRPHRKVAVQRPVPDLRDVVVLWGTGGGQFAADDLASLRAAVAPHRVWCAGRFDGIANSEDDASVVTCGWVSDVGPLLINRPVVVASAGNNAVADVAGAGSPLVVVPQQRPFDEQLRHAQCLEAVGAASIVFSGSSTATWNHALATARSRRDVLSSLADRDGAAEAARIISSAFPC
ncbi:glycosyltransferase, partial [Ilumatobacter nonamiensis]|uniref:glycosyltransferase n=1 Tax=Ilumatobacter nonamiensis TaxID=467093 RepID=UPI0006858EF4